MRTIRLYVDAALAPTGELVLPEAAARHALRVLRVRVGQSLLLFNGDGCDYAASVQTIRGTSVGARVTGKQTLDNEAPWPVTLAQCVARGDKMDLIVQKATELGVARIVPILGERSGVRLDETRSDKRVQRWQAVAIAACEQCGRARLPQVEAVRTMQAWLAELPASGALRLALTPGATQRVRDLHPPGAGMILVVGPEGGLGEHDTAALTSAGFMGLALGPRILRTETAGLAALAALQAYHGDV